MSLEAKMQSNLQELYPGMGKGKEAVAPAQGSSQRDVPVVDLGKDEPGKVAASKAKKQPVPTNKGAGQAPNFKTVADPTTVVTMTSSKGNVQEDTDLEDDDVISEDEFLNLSDEEQEEWEMIEDLDADLDEEMTEEELDEEVIPTFTFDPTVLFAGDETLTEEFKAKATSIFESLVTARVSELREQIEDEAAALATEAVAEHIEDLAEVMDAYLTEAVQVWIEQNELAVETGLRTEITETFIGGLRNLFAESYIDVPEDKVDLIGDLTDAVEALEAKLEEQTDITEEVLVELHEIQREAALTAVSEGLAMTQADKLRSLTEDVSFEDAETFTAKLTAIRENFFNSRPEEKTVLVEAKKQDDTVMRLANMLPSPMTFSK
jgi:hypothetical protein